MEKLRAKLGLNSPVGRSHSKWTLEDIRGLYDVLVNCAYSTQSMTEELYPHITSLGSMVPLLRQIYWGIVSEEKRRKWVSKEIKRLKEDISGLPITDIEIKSWIVAHDTEHMDELRKLLDKQFKEVCLDFLLVSQNSDADMFLRNMLSTFEGPWVKCVSGVHDIIYKSIKHLQGKREMISEVSEWTSTDIMSLEFEEISEDEFLSVIEHGPVQIQYSPNRQFLKLKPTLHFGWSDYTRVEWHTSVRHNKLLQLLLFEDCSVMEGTGDCLLNLQPQEVKDSFCYISRTSGDTPPVGRIQCRVDTFKRRQRVVTTGSTDTPYYIGRSGRIVVASKRGVSLWTGTPYYITRSSRLLAATRKCHRRSPPLWIYATAASISAATRRRRRPCAPPLWIYDTGSSICMTGDLSLLRGAHDAGDMTATGVSGMTIASSKCGRISGAVNLPGVRYFPGSKVNLISGGVLGSLGCEIIMNAKGCKIMKDGQVIGGGRLLPNKTYSVDFLDDKLLAGTICSGCRH